MIPGEVIPAQGVIETLAGAPRIELDVHNAGDRPVQVGSHFHFFEVNRRLRFDRAAAFGMHLDILAGATVRWEPGQTRQVRLVEFAGRREIFGFNGLVDGPLTDEHKAIALERARERGFLSTDS